MTTESVEGIATAAYWAGDLRGHGIDSGHHVAEEAPDALAAALGDFFGG